MIGRYLVLCSSPSSGFYNPGQQVNTPPNTHANSNPGSNASAIGTPKPSNAHQASSNQASNNSTSQGSSNTAVATGNSGQHSKAIPLKQTGAKSGLRRAAIGKYKRI